MTFLQELAEVLFTIRTDMDKPDSVRKGDQFRWFVEDVLFPKTKYDLLHKSCDSGIKGESSILRPTDTDFKFSCRDTGFQFVVEAKYREDFLRGGITLCDQWEFSQYYQINRECPLFFALGVGGIAEAPQDVYLVPFEKVYYVHLYRRVFEPYRVSSDEPVTNLWLAPVAAEAELAVR